MGGQMSGVRVVVVVVVDAGGWCRGPVTAA